MPTKPKNLSFEFNKLINYSKPPLSRSPTPSRDSSKMTHLNYISNSSKQGHTPLESGFSTENKLLNFSEQSIGGGAGGN